MELNKIYHTDALSGLRSLPEQSVDCIVTSPPYWQMRDYGIAPIWWNAEMKCNHQINEQGYCVHCGGWLGQLGHEPTREEYVCHLLNVFNECRKVLKKTGTLWVNVGDSYSKPYKYNIYQNDKWYKHNKNNKCMLNVFVDKKQHYIPSKSLCNIPNKFADEMILDGWILRNEIIWHKPNGLPSSVTDRFTVDYEKIFFFVKNSRYQFNQQFEPYADSTFNRYRYPMTSNGKCEEFQRISGSPKGIKKINPNGRNMRCVWRISSGHNKEKHYAMYPERLVEVPILAGSPEKGIVLDPFMGAGTTAVVAKRLKRNFIGFDANSEYVDIANGRFNNM